MTSDGPSTDSWDEVFVWGSSNTIWYEGFSKDLDLDSTYSSFIVSSEYPSFIDPWESTSFVDLLEYPGFNRFIDPLECSSFIEQLESSPGFKAAWKSKWESIFVDLLERPCFNILCERPCFKAKWESKWKQEFESLKQNSAWGEAWARRKALPLSELPSIDKQPGSFRFPKDPSMLIRTGPHMHLYLQERWKKLDEVHLDVVTKSLARSERALDDLVELVQKSNDVGKTVLPIIFYGVDPSDVPNQTGSFAEAFAYYDKKYKDEPGKVERWRAALRKLGNLAGWDSKHWTEGKLIQDVVDETRRILCSSFSKPPEKIMSSTPSWSFSCRQKHDVFLSFRGKDTRLNFLDHLYDHYDNSVQNFHL
uniref:uncharacterized protein LOC105350847 n=1 Tax=Fragaria vesca subsp. vesca TaxID=101020 RepID=UPI0005C8C44F|nr:PREDICTED: uncharacterized protein LOC105350847 [Fragaria vesca subsp. vesca]